jgi:hypothetical protein
MAPFALRYDLYLDLSSDEEEVERTASKRIDTTYFGDLQEVRCCALPECRKPLHAPYDPSHRYRTLPLPRCWKAWLRRRKQRLPLGTGEWSAAQ